MTRSLGKLKGRSAAAEAAAQPTWRPYRPPRWEPPRPGSMRHLELPSLAGGERYYPRRPWVATDK